MFYLTKRYLIIKRVFLLTILFSGITSDAQNLSELPDDSTKVQQLLDLAYSLEIEYPDSAILIYEQCAEISQKVNYKIGYARAVQYQGVVYSDQGNYDEALVKYQTAIEAFEKVPYEIGVASTYVNIGLIQKRKAEFASAFQNFMEGTRIFEQIGDTSRLVMSYTAMSAVMQDVEQYDKSTYYQLKSLNIARQIKDSLSICDGLVNLAITDLIENRTDSAVVKLLQSLEIANALNDPRLLALTHNSLSEIYGGKLETEKAMYHASTGLKNAEKLGNPVIISTLLSTQGHNYYVTEKLDSALFYIQKSILIAEEYDISESLRSTYRWMADLQEKLGNEKEALRYYKAFQKLEEKEIADRRTRIISGLQMQYETEKKDLEIATQNITIERNQAQISQRNTFILALVGAILSLCLLLYVIQRSLKQKKTIAEKDAAIKQDKLIKLQTEQEVIVLQSIMDGEEKERTRLAKDLHDGLGGLLSVVKLHYSNVSSSDFLHSKDNKKGMQLLDNVSAEARKISHNLMPDALLKFGVIDALKDYCNNINASNELEVDFQSYNIEKRFSKSIETNVFRIVQELINNTIKHANATELSVQLMKVEKILHITIEDNGKGFNFNELTNSGIGLSNIQSRIEYLQGKINYDSRIGEGTNILIEIPVDGEAK